MIYIYVYMHYTCPKDTSGVSMSPWPGTQHKELATISCDDPGTIMSLLKKARIVFQTSLRSAYVYHKNKTPGDIPSVRLLHPLHSVKPVHRDFFPEQYHHVSPMAWHFMAFHCFSFSLVLKSQCLLVQILNSVLLFA